MLEWQTAFLEPKLLLSFAVKLFSASVVIALTQGEVVEEVSLLQNKVFTDDDFDAALSRATSDLPKATDATGAEVDDMVGTFS